MSDLDFTPAPAIPAPSGPTTPPSGADAPSSPSRPPGVRLMRIAFAMLVPLGLYVEAGSGYFTTACRPFVFADNIAWGWLVLIVIAIVKPVPFVISYLAVAGSALAIPRSPRAIRIRNRLAIGLAIVVPIVALIAGEIAPARCTPFYLPLP